MRKYGLIILIFIVFTGCKFGSDQIKESFETVNKSLEKSNDSLKKSQKEYDLYLEIKSAERANKQMALTADSLITISNDLINYIDSLKNAFIIMDITGENTFIVSNTLLKKGIAISLNKRLNGFYKFSSHSAIDLGIKHQIDSTCSDFYTPEKDWATFYFKNNSTIGIITILSKFNLDCLSTRMIVLENMNNHLKKL